MAEDEEAELAAARSIFKGGSIVFIGIVISKLSALGYRVLVGRQGPADYGVISVMMAVFSVATIVSFMGVPKGVHRFVSEYREDGDIERAADVYKAGSIMTFAAGLVIGILLFVFAPWLSTEVFGEPRAILPIRMIAVAVPLRGIHSNSLSVTNAYEKMQYHVYVERLYDNGVQLLLAVALVAAGYGYLGAAFAYAFGFGSAALLAMYYARKMFGRDWSLSLPSPDLYGKLARYSWPLMAAGLFGLVTGYIDTFLLQVMVGTSAVGLYQAAYPFAQLLKTGNQMFSNIFFSNASKLAATGRMEELASSYRTVVKWVGMVTVPIFLIMVLFPRAVLSIFGSQYYGVVNVLRVLASGFFLSAVVGPAGKIYQAVDRTKINFGLSVFVASVNVALNVVLIPRGDWLGGPMGAAVASAVTFLLVTIIHVVLVTRILGRQPFRRSMVRVVAAAVTAAGVVYLLSNAVFAVTPFWFFLVDLAVFGVVYAVLVGFGGILESEDREIVEAILRKAGLDEGHAEKLRYR